MLKSAKEQAYGIDWHSGTAEDRLSFLQSEWLDRQFHIDGSYERLRHSLCFNKDQPMHIHGFQQGRDRLTAIRVLRMLGRWDVPC
jgi:hypothetical protein